MNILNDIFSSTLKNELKTVTYKGESYNCFFRRNDTSNDNAYTTVYFPVDKYLSRGATFSYGLDNYIIIKNLTSENDVYRKVQAIKCNNSFKVIYAKNEIIEYKCFMNDLSNSLNTNGGSITIDSNIEFILELNDASKRLIINRRFFSGFMGLAWVIREINYIDGLCYVYCERSPINSDDDVENGIADRWHYDSSTEVDNYRVTTTDSSYNLLKDNTSVIGSKLYKNDVEIDNSLIVWTISDPTICSIANDTITALAVGTTTVEGSYKVNSTDVCTKATFTVTVTEEVDPEPTPTEKGYETTVSKSNMALELGGTETDTSIVTITKNDVVVDNNFEITVSDSSICSATINNKTITVKALAEGTATITVSPNLSLTEYQDDYPYTEATITVTITKAVITDPYITVSPVYNNTDFYSIIEGTNITFTAKLNNATSITSPKWSCTVTSPTLVSGTDYVVIINSNKRSVQIINSNASSKTGYINIHYAESVSGCTYDYKVYLQ